MRLADLSAAAITLGGTSSRGSVQTWPSNFRVGCFFALDDLPVIGSHKILAGVNRLLIKNADAPVKLGRQKFLGDDEVRGRPEVVPVFRPTPQGCGLS